MNSLEDDQSSSNPAGEFEGREETGWWRWRSYVWVENQPTQQGFGEFGDQSAGFSSRAVAKETRPVLCAEEARYCSQQAFLANRNSVRHQVAELLKLGCGRIYRATLYCTALHIFLGTTRCEGKAQEPLVLASNELPRPAAKLWCESGLLSTQGARAKYA